jgi:hypothetical protein
MTVAEFKDALPEAATKMRNLFDKSKEENKKKKVRSPPPLPFYVTALTFFPPLTQAEKAKDKEDADKENPKQNDHDKVNVQDEGKGKKSKAPNDAGAVNKKAKAA